MYDPSTFYKVELWMFYFLYLYNFDDLFNNIYGVRYFYIFCIFFWRRVGLGAERLLAHKQLIKKKVIFKFDAMQAISQRFNQTEKFYCKSFQSWNRILMISNEDIWSSLSVKDTEHILFYKIRVPYCWTIYYIEFE